MNELLPLPIVANYYALSGLGGYYARICHRAAPDALILGPFRAGRIGQTDREIDQLVYNLYGLDADEIKIIENRFWIEFDAIPLPSALADGYKCFVFFRPLANNLSF